MNGTDRPEAARTQHTPQDTRREDGSMIVLGAGTLAQIAAVSHTKRQGPQIRCNATAGGTS